MRSALRSGFAFFLAFSIVAISGCGNSNSIGTCTGNCPTNVPFVSSSSPAGGATGVAVTSAVTATFDMPMNAATLTTSTFTLSSSGGAVAGTVSYSNSVATFTPSAALAYNTLYTAIITTGAESSAGGFLSANYTWSFTTASAPAPTVTAESPASGAANVSVSTTVTATFSEAMQPSSLTSSTFTLADSGGNAVSGTITYDSGSDTATLAPSSPLSYATQYTATITTGATASNGAALASGFTWQFTTAAAPAPPTVTSTTPVSGATGVAINTAISAVFSVPMNSASFTATSFTVNAQGGGGVAGSVSYDAATQTATFMPAANLSYGTTYIATLTTAVTSSSGQALASNDTWSFTTIQAPAVLSTTPASGATSVAVTANVTATFSMAMNPTTLTTATFMLTGPGGTQVAGNISYAASSNTATFTPSASLAYNTAYSATITTGAQNSGGVGLSSNYTWSFTTEATPSGMVTVDFGAQEQIIRGFGGSTAWLGQLTQQQANELFGLGTQGGLPELGLSILRVRIDPTGSATSSPPWATSNWDQEINNANAAVAANPNVIVFASPWTPPVSMKTGSQPGEPYYSGGSPCSPGPGYCGGSLDPSNYAAYAAYLNQFVAYFNAFSTNPLYAISMQNEPDWNAQPSENYESCGWTAAQMDSWIDAEGSTLQAPLIMPESLNFNPAQAAPSLSDSTAVADITIVGGHLYGTSPSYYTQAKNAGKDIWMTEHYLNPSGTNPTMGDALSFAQEIHNSMVTGQYNAYVWWWIWDQASYINYGLINSNTSSPTPTYFGYAIGQFSRFIQPGYYRYNATAAPSSNVYVSAYAGSTHYVVVAINSGSNSVSQPFTIQNATVTSMTPWQTTSSAGLQQLSPVSVSSGQFTYTLPPQSITTFVQ